MPLGPCLQPGSEQGARHCARRGDPAAAGQERHAAGCPGDRARAGTGAQYLPLCPARAGRRRSCRLRSRHQALCARRRRPDAGAAMAAAQPVRRSGPAGARSDAGDFGVTMLGVQIVGLDHIIVVAARAIGPQFPAQHPGRQPLPGADQRDRAVHRRVRRLSEAELDARFKRCAGTSHPASRMARRRSRRPARMASRSMRAIISPA
jgi:hypothetical protein